MIFQYNSVCQVPRESIGIAPINTIMHVRNENSTHSREVTRCGKWFSIPLGTAFKGKNSLTLGANSFGL